MQVFKRRAAAMVAFRPGIAPDLRVGAEKAIAAGRYLIFGGEEEGTATLLLSSEPRLVAVVRKAADEPGHTPSFDVLSVREAQADLDREREELSQL
jgi:hypothetical protein